MTPSQRGTLVAVPLMVVLAFGLILYKGNTTNYVPLSWGKTFSFEEMSNAEQALLEAGLTEFQTEGRRIMVPKSEIDRYNTALLEGDSLPNNWAEEWQKQFETNRGMFPSSRELEQHKEIARGKLIAQMIRGVPDIETADVIWARGQGRTAWNQKPKVTATVFVRPRSGREVSSSLAKSLRSAVANMVPDLTAAEVTVFDQSNGMTFGEEEADSYDNRYLDLKKQNTRYYHELISQAVAEIPNAQVAVNVELSDLKSSFENKQEVNPKNVVDVRTSETRDEITSSETPQQTEPGQVVNRPASVRGPIGRARNDSTVSTTNEASRIPSITVTTTERTPATVQSVRVTVGIPKEHYRTIALQQGLTEGQTDQEKADFQKQLDTIQTDVEQKVTAQVRTLLPIGSPEDAVNVTSYVRVETEQTEPNVPLTETVSSAISQWGSVAGLALFALWALWMLNKSMSKLPQEESEEMISPALAMIDADDEEADEELPREVTKQEQLQSTVRDNPEMAAAVLSKWIQS